MSISTVLPGVISPFSSASSIILHIFFRQHRDQFFITLIAVPQIYWTSALKRNLWFWCGCYNMIGYCSCNCEDRSALGLIMIFILECDTVFHRASWLLPFQLPHYPCQSSFRFGDVLYFHEWRPSYELQWQRKKSWRFWGERCIHLLTRASGRLISSNRFDCKWTDPLLRISFILLRATPYVFTWNANTMVSSTNLVPCSPNKFI